MNSRTNPEASVTIFKEPHHPFNSPQVRTEQTCIIFHTAFLYRLKARHLFVTISLTLISSLISTSLNFFEPIQKVLSYGDELLITVSNRISLFEDTTVSKISGTHADACFVPYSNVAAYIYINNGKTLPVVTYMAAKPKDSWKGLKVYKSGRTTGVTSGIIKGIQDIDNSLGKYYGLLDTDVPCSGGDSGAPLYTMPTSGNSCNLLGIHKGGDSSHCYFSSVYGINYDLGVLPITT